MLDAIAIVASAIVTLLLFGVMVTVMSSITWFFGSIAALLFGVAKDMVLGPNDARITISIPKSAMNQATRKQTGDTESAKSSSFFEDVNGLDLEYRGVGVAEDRAGASALGKVIS